MKRREFIRLLGGAVATWPIAARAQSGVPVLGLLGSQTAENWARPEAAFRAGLSQGGFDIGRQVTMDYRRADGKLAQLPALAADLVGRRASVIFATGGNEPAFAALAATKTIPIVFVTGADPVAVGLVPHANRPGGNTTGISFQNGELIGKRLELLSEVTAQSKAIGILVNPDASTTTRNIAAAQNAARAFGRALHVYQARNESEIDGAFDLIAQDAPGALILNAEPFFNARKSQIVAHIARLGIPAVHNGREWAVAGGLFSYGADILEAHRLAGLYTARILKGEKPGDLPVMYPIKFELVINLKTVRALHLELPPKVLALADEVIE